MANGNKLLDQKAIDTIIDSILKAVEIKLNKKPSEGRGKDGKDGRDGKNAPQINDDEALSTNPWSGLKTQEEIAKVEGKIYPCTAQALEAMTQEQQAELYVQGYRAIKTENNGTVVLLGLSADGSLEWLGCNQPRGNLLDNGNFINPVNQRGVTSALSNSSNYFIDRWMTYQANVNNVTYSLVDNGISLTPVEQGNYAGMQQRIETPLSTGEDYTIIFSVDGDNIVLPVTGGTDKIGEETNNIYLSYVTNYGGYNTVRVVFTTNRSFVVNNARVIKGSYTPKTLPPWKELDQMIERFKCTDYLTRSSASARYVGDGGDTTSKVRVYIPIGKRMRANPKVYPSSGISISVRVQTGAYNDTNATINNVTIDDFGLLLEITGSRQIINSLYANCTVIINTPLLFSSDL